MQVRHEHPKKGKIWYTKDMAEIRPLTTITRADQALVGETIALLGELSGNKEQGKLTPAALVFSKNIYEQFIEHNKLKNVFKAALAGTDLYKCASIEATSTHLRKCIMRGTFPETVRQELNKVAAPFKGKRLLMRSSPVPDQSDVHCVSLERDHGLVTTADSMLAEIKQAIADYFLPEQITFILSKGYDYRSVPLAFMAQEVVEATVSGEITTQAATMIVASRRGVRREVAVYETCTLFTPSLLRGLVPVIRREYTQQKKAWVLRGSQYASVSVDASEKRKAILSDVETVAIGKLTHKIVQDFGSAITLSFAYHRDAQAWSITGVRQEKNVAANVHKTFCLERTGIPIVMGRAVGQAIGAGPVAHISNITADTRVTPGAVVVVNSADVRFAAVLEQASAVIAEEDDAESFVAQFCRERGLPCILGVKKTKQLFKEGQLVTVSCASGLFGTVFKAILPYKVEESVLPKTTSTPLRITVTDAAAAAALAHLPVQGVGLLPEESLYAKYIGIHPQALVESTSVPKAIKEAVRIFADGKKPDERATERLAEEIAGVAAAFHGREVVFRFSAADTAEYSNLLGGTIFEKKEKNPAMGWRGVARFIDPSFAKAFAITTKALHRVREEWGMHNVSVLVPFCRTVEEGKIIIELLRKAGLVQGKNGLKIYVMCEIPANALLAEEFIRLFDGFEIGLNRLTEFTLGVDRAIFSERAYHEEDRAVKQLIREVIKVAHRRGKTVGICDTTTSEHPHFASFLVQERIDSITVLPDRWHQVQTVMHQAEKKLHAEPLALPFKMLSKAVSMAGFVGISLLLTGYTCQTVNVDQLKQELAAKTEQEIREHKLQLDHQLAEERALDIAKATERYHERGFADFSLTYPAGWRVANTPAQTALSAAVGEGVFKVRRELRKAMREYTFTSTSTWQGNDVGLYAGEGVRGIVIFPEDKAYKEVVIMEGDQEHFEKIWQSVENFYWVPKLK